MRSAHDLTWDLEALDSPFSTHAYGLFTGLVVSYSRPFIQSRSNSYGALEKKWSTFPGRDDLTRRHKELIEYRNKLLAHNDRTPFRVTMVWPGFSDGGQPAIFEARALIGAMEIGAIRHLCEFQQCRLAEAVQTLGDQLQKSLGWQVGDELDLDQELRRLRSEQTAGE